MSPIRINPMYLESSNRRFLFLCCNTRMTAELAIDKRLAMITVNYCAHNKKIINILVNFQLF